MSNRVSPLPSLPVQIDPELRRALVEVLRLHALQINWATGQDTQRITSSADVAADLVLADATGGTVSCQLPKASDWQDRTIAVKKTDASANVVQLTPATSETIDGSATASIGVRYTCLQVMSDGAGWHIVAEYVA